MAAVLDEVLEGGTVYLTASGEAGGKLASSERLSGGAELAKSIRPDLTIAAGLGIRTPEDVARIAKIPAIDAVVIGSAFVSSMKTGSEAVEHYLSIIEPALARTL